LRSYGAFEREGNMIIALEYMDAGSLASILKKVEKISEPVLGLISK
jgi:serine/threonine protein kinase